MKNTLTVVLLVVCFVGCAGIREALAQTDTFMNDWIDVASLTQTLETTKKNPLQNARITSISTFGNGGYVERVTLGAASVQLLFYPQRLDGSLGAPIISSFAC